MRLDFDEVSFAELCTNVAPEETNAANNAKIHIGGSGYFKGSYIPVSKEMFIAYSGKLGTDNKKLRHETRHYLDDIKGRETNNVYIP